MITFAQVPHDPHPGISQQRSTWSCLDPLRKHRNRSLRRKHYHRPRGLRAHEAIRHGTERPTRLSVLRGQFRNHPAILRKPAGCVRLGNIQISSLCHPERSRGTLCLQAIDLARFTVFVRMFRMLPSEYKIDYELLVTNWPGSRRTSSL